MDTGKHGPGGAAPHLAGLNVASWRKRPVVIQAVQWTGSNAEAVKAFCGRNALAGEDAFLLPGEITGVAEHALLWTAKSCTHCAVPAGAWVIAEPDGSGFYPCSADDFAATYEPAGDQPGDGVTRWTVTRIGLAAALRGVPAETLHAASCPGCNSGAATTDLADAILAALPADGEGGTEGDSPSTALLSLAAEFDRLAANASGSLVRSGTLRGAAFREAAAEARARAGAPRSGPDGAGPVSPGTESGSGAYSAAQDGPGEYRLSPSPLAAWRVTRESGGAIADWWLGSWYDGEAVQVHAPIPDGPLTVPEGWWVIRYGTSAADAGLFWAVPGDLFESAYASAETPGGQS